MKILGYQSQMGIQNASGGQSAGYQHPSAFVSAGQERLPHDLSNLSKGLSQLGGAMHQIGIERRQEVMELDLIKTVNDREAEAKSFMDDYMQNNQGRNAIDAETAYAEFGQKMLDEERGRWAGNKRALAFLERSLGGMVNRGVDTMRDYGNKQLDSYREAEIKTQFSLAEEAWSNPNASDDERHEKYGQWERMFVADARKKGLPPEQVMLAVDTAYRSFSASKLEQSFYNNLNKNDTDAAERDLQAMNSGDPSSLSAQYESGGLGSYAIGYDSNEGTSYGTYQLSSKQGTMDDFIGWLDAKDHTEAAKALREAGPTNTGSKDGKFVQTWLDLADAGLITKKIEREFIEESHVKPVFDALPKGLQEAVQADPKMQQALYSTAVQHGAGGATKLFKRNWEKAGGENGSFLQTLYADRKTQFGSSDPATQASVAARLDREFRMLGVAVVGPEKLGKLTKMLADTKSAKQSAIIRSDYDAVMGTIKDVPYEQWDEVVYARLLQYPEENRKDIKALYEGEKELLKKARDGQDLGIIERFVAGLSEQGISPAMMKHLALENTNKLIEGGLSPDGLKLLDKHIESRDIETAQNKVETDTVRKLIDEEALSDPEQVKLYAFQKGMTTKQIEASLSYLEKGGQQGELYQMRKKIDDALKYYNKGKGLEHDPDFYDAFQKSLEPGQKITDDHIRKTVVALLTEGERKSGRGLKPFGYGADMTYAEAVRQGQKDNWLPTVDTKTSRRIRAEFRQYRIYDLTDEEVRWVRRKELGLPVPTDKIRTKGGTYATR